MKKYIRSKSVTYGQVKLIFNSIRCARQDVRHACLHLFQICANRQGVTSLSRFSLLDFFYVVKLLSNKIELTCLIIALTKTN